MVDILDLLFPPRCVNCRKFGQYVCSSCEVGLWEQEQVCPGCGHSSQFGQTHIRCRSRTPLLGLTCLWTNAGIARKLLQRSQHQHLTSYLNYLLKRSQSLTNLPDWQKLGKFLRLKPQIVKLDSSLATQALASLMAQKYFLRFRSQSDSSLLITAVWNSKIANELKLDRTQTKKYWGLSLVR